MSPAELLARFEGRRVVVLGDLGVDCYVETRPTRLSREAPVLILRYERRRFSPGCAANTVMNLRALGAVVTPIGVVGDDEPGRELLAAFEAAGVPRHGLVVAGRSVMKIRLMSGDYSRPQQQLVRVDVEPDHAYGEDTMLELIARAGAAEGAEGIVVSEYGYGAAAPGLLRAIRGVAPEARVSVDSRHLVGDFEGVDLITPNEWEAATWLGVPVEEDEEAREAALELKRRSGAGAVLLTRGNRGMVLADEELHVLPISGSTDIVDPSGAGDTVVAAAALARLAGGSYLEAAQLATHAAGVSVMRAGAQPVSLAELKEAVARG